MRFWAYRTCRVDDITGEEWRRRRASARGTLQREMASVVLFQSPAAACFFSKPFDPFLSKELPPRSRAAASIALDSLFSAAGARVLILCSTKGDEGRRNGWGPVARGGSIDVSKDFSPKSYLNASFPCLLLELFSPCCCSHFPERGKKAAESLIYGRRQPRSERAARLVSPARRQGALARDRTYREKHEQRRTWLRGGGR